MDAAAAGQLVAVTGLAFEKAQATAGRHAAHLAIVLGPEHCVIGGLPGVENEICEAMRAAGAENAVVLPVSVPSHTPLLNAAVGPFREALASASWQPPTSPIFAGINANKVLTRQQMLESLPEQIHRTVRWDIVEERMAEAECHVVLELGPGCQLAHTLFGGRFQTDARSADEFRSAEGIAAWAERSLKHFG